jgi:mutator protein MutT
MMTELKHIASCALLINDQGKILGVSRKDDLNDWNLPGGKAEPGETPEDTAIRETKEETGLDISNLVSVRKVRREGGVVSYFHADFSGQIASSEEGAVRWLHWNDLLRPENTFHKTNQRLFDQLYGHKEDV